MSDTLSEAFIQDAFHSYLKSSLTQAKAERLLDADVLSSAEGDLMITGPALCLYFAALRCTTNPPSVPLPRRMKNQSSSTVTTSHPVDLTPANCPPAFQNFLSAWVALVPRIQSLTPERQHDLARVICSLPPLQPSEHTGVGDLAQRMRAVAIEISQRRTFQDRYAGDLQAALDLDANGVRKTASFVPPPSYEAASPSHSPNPSSNTALPDSHAPLPDHSYPTGVGSSHTRTYSASSTLSASTNTSARSRTPSPMQLEAIQLIRETLYASLADVLQEHARTLGPIMRSDPPRAYFASVSLAILDVALQSLVWVPRSSNGSTNSSEDADGLDGEQCIGVRGVMDTTLTLSVCPEPLKPFMRELCALGEDARKWRSRDDVMAIRALRHDKKVGVPLLDRVRDLLIRGAYGDGSGVESDGEGGKRSASPEGRTLAFVNRIGALALGMTKLRAFRERQDEVFGILQAVMGD